MKRSLFMLMLVLTVTLGLAWSASAETIHVWTGFPELEPFYKWAGEEFSKTHPGVDFEVISTSLREFEQKLTTALPTGTGPEVFDVGPYIAIKLIDGGVLPANPQDLNEHLKSGAWSDFSVDYVTVDGNTYGIPMMNGSRAALYYNKAMFREAGLDPENPPKTFPELMDVAKKLTTYDANGNVLRSGLSLRISGGGSGLTEKFRFFLSNAGGEVIVPSGDGKWKNGFDSEAGRKTLKAYIDAIYTDKIDSPEVRHDAEAFVTGDTAMFLRESWVIGEIQSKNPDLEYGVAPMPSWDRWETLAQPWSVYMSMDGAKSQNVRDYIKLLTSESTAEKLIELSGWMPDRSFDWEGLVAKTPQYEVFVNPPSEMGFFADPVLPAFDEIQTKVADKLVEAFLNKDLATDDAALVKTVSEIGALIDSILKRNRVYGN